MKLFTAAICIVFFLVLSADAGGLQVLTAPDGTEVIILRDCYGVPHIKGETETGVFFGQGFASAEDRYYQIEIWRREALGRLAEISASEADFDLDKEILTMSHTHQERVQAFNGLPSEIQSMLEAFKDGINSYVDSAIAYPAKYLPYEFISEGIDSEYWSVYDLLAIRQRIQFFYSSRGGEELERLAELQDKGWEWFNENRPINDPAAFATIVEDGNVVSRSYHYSDMTVSRETVNAIREREEKLDEHREKSTALPRHGSYEAAISGEKSSSGNVMLLSCPRYTPPQERYTNAYYEIELECPNFNVGGKTMALLPLFDLGNTDYFGWGGTTGYSDQIDVYIDSTKDETFSYYYHNGQWLEFEVIQDTIYKGNTPVPFTHYRTIHGPVFAADLDSHQVFSKKNDFLG